MTVTERKLAICYDVIDSINQNELKCVSDGTGYILYSRNVQNNLNRNDDNLISKEDVKELKNNCSVCARGAMLLSRIDKFNKLTWSDVWDSQSATSKGLKDIFTEHELSMIENAFERNMINGSYANNDLTQKLVSAVKFGKKCSDDNKKRLVQIMQNIIYNNGKVVLQ